MADATIITYNTNAPAAIGPSEAEFADVVKIYGKTTTAIMWYLAECIDDMEPGEANYIHVCLWSGSYPAERVQKVVNETYKEYGEFIILAYG